MNCINSHSVSRTSYRAECRAHARLGATGLLLLGAILGFAHASLTAYAAQKTNQQASRAIAGGAKPRESTSPAFPLKVSENRRYLVDQRGRPFFFHADTAWQLAKRLKREDVEVYLDDRKSRGFTAILIQSFSKEVTPLPNAYSEVPFDKSENILKPNEAYWRHVDFVIEQAARRGFAVAMAPIWIRRGGEDKHGWRNHLTDDNARSYGEFIGRRYARFDNLLWILGGDANPKEKTEAIRSLAQGIKEHAPDRLIMVHNAPEHPSARFFGDDDWLDINMAYSYKEVYPQILGEWTGKGSVKPILLGESGYEEESNDKRGGAPWRMRRQAYQAILAGALGGHAFGQKHIWRFDDEWRGALDSPGSRQMTHVKNLFTSRRWHLLEPDHANKLVVDGQGKAGEVEYVMAARASDGSFAVLYFPTTVTVKLNLKELGGPVKAQWYDPTTGKSQTIANFASADSHTVSVTPPQKNSAGDPDWVLVLETPTRDRASTQVETTGDAVTIKNESDNVLLRYQLKGGADKNLSVPSGCYFHPFSTPFGVVVTEVAPDDHRHHRGIFLAFVEMHGKWDADFWGWGEHAPIDGRVIVNRSVTAGQDKNPVITAHNEWTADGKTVIQEKLVAALAQLNKRANVLDLHSTLTATADTTLSQWAFSGFCVRTRKDAKLTAIGPEGDVKLPNPSHLEPKSDWPAARWYAYELQLKDDTTVGVAVVNHPQNPPTLWHNHRDIRMLNPSIVAPAEVKLRREMPLHLRYRVVAYDGRTQGEELNRLASEFAKVK